MVSTRLHLRIQSRIALGLRQNVRERAGIGGDGGDVVGAFALGLINDGDRHCTGFVGRLVLVIVRLDERLVAVHAGLGDLRENLLQLARRLALDIALFDDDAELFLFGQVNHAISHGLFEFRSGA